MKHRFSRGGLKRLILPLFLEQLLVMLAGVAWPSFLSRLFSAAAVTWFCRKASNPVSYAARNIFTWDGGAMKRILRIAVPNSVENGAFQLIKIALSSITATPD